MNTIDKVKQWFIDRDLEDGGRLDSSHSNSARSSVNYAQDISRRMRS